MTAVGATVPGEVVRLDPRRRVAVIQLPRLGEGAFRFDVALPGEQLAPAVEYGYASPRGRTAGGVTAVRPRDTGTEVDVHVSDDSTWQRLGERGVRVHVKASFGAVGPNPRGGVVERLEIS